MPYKEKDGEVFKNPDFSSIKYSNQLAIVDGENNINGWTPSVSDSLANDWRVYKL